MADNFYKKDGSYYNATNNSKILNLDDLGKLSKAGGKEISAPVAPAGSVAIPNPQAIPNYNVTANIGGTLFGTPKQPSNVIDSKTLQAGVATGDITSQLPPSTANTIREVETKNAQNFSEQAKDTLKIFEQQMKDAQAKIAEGEKRLAEIEAQRKEQVIDPLKDATAPFRAQLETDGNTKYKLEEKYYKFSELSNNLSTYSDMAYSDIVAEQNRPALLSVSEGRVNNVKDDWNTKIALTKTAMAALSDDIALGRTFIDRGIKAIEADRQDQLNFLNFMNGLLDIERGDTKEKIINATADEKKAINDQIETVKSEFSRIQEEKDSIRTFLLENAEIALKAGVNLSDDLDTMTGKVNTFLEKNPQYLPSHRAIIGNWVSQYPDAKILLTDTIEQAEAKILTSPSYQKSIRVGGSGSGKKSNEPVTFQSAMEDTAQYLINLRDNGKLTDLSYNQAISAFMSDFDISDEQRGTLESQINNIMAGGAPQPNDNNPTSDFVVDTRSYSERGLGTFGTDVPTYLESYADVVSSPFEGINKKIGQGLKSAKKFLLGK